MGIVWKMADHVQYWDAYGAETHILRAIADKLQKKGVSFVELTHKQTTNGYSIGERFSQVEIRNSYECRK